jgi:putative copper export protein
MSPGFLALYAVVRGLIYVGLLLLVGTQAAGALFARQVHDAELADPLHRRLIRFARWLLAPLIVAMLARGVLQLMSFLDPGDVITFDLVRGGLFSGSWGHAWLLQVAATTAGLAVLTWRRDRVRTPDPLTVILAAVILWAQTGMGHAAGDNWRGVSGRLLDLTHLTGVGLWVGTLAVVLVVGLPLLRAEPQLPALASVARAFSVYARVGALLAVISGATAALVYSGGSLAIIPASAWGRLLLLKLAGMLGVLAVGWYNWRVVTPALEARHVNSPDTLRRAIRVELGLSLVMLAITTLLVVSPLPGEN